MTDRISAARRKLRKELGREPKVTEVAKEIGETHSMVFNVYRYRGLDTGRGRYEAEAAKADNTPGTIDGGRVRKMLRAKGMTVLSLATAAGVSVSQVYRLLRLPMQTSPATAEALAKVLGVTADEIMVSKAAPAKRKRESS